MTDNTTKSSSGSNSPSTKNDSFKEKTDFNQEESVPAEPVYRLIIDEGVVEKVAAKAAQKIGGVIDMKGNLLARVQEGLGGNAHTKGVDADVIDDIGAKVDLNVILEYGKSAPDVFEEIKDVVTEDLESMTGLSVVEMNVNVVDVMTSDEYAQKTGTNNDGGQEGAN